MQGMQETVQRRDKRKSQKRWDSARGEYSCADGVKIDTSQPARPCRDPVYEHGQFPCSEPNQDPVGP